VGASFRGTIQGDEIKGTFSQNGLDQLVTFTRTGGDMSSTNGDWQGKLGLVVIFHINLDGPSTSDSPDQNSYGMPMDVTANGNEVQLTVPSVGAAFRGFLQGDKIKGTFSQNGGYLPLTLIKK
jgi:hypothetical protein